MRKVLIFSCILGLALIGCSNNNPMANESNENPVFAYPGSSPDPMTQSTAVAQTHLVAVNSSELNVPAGTDTYLCLWTSGTYYDTGTWNYTDTDFDYTVNSSGTLYVETINYLCNPTAGNLTTAAAFYYPPTEKKALNYDLFGSVTWGFLPGLPTDWCWILMVDYGWSGVPHSHGISVNLDWAGAYNHGDTLPPIAGVCGWPLSSDPPGQFTVHGI
jgi:hypothetical protein